MMREAGCVLVVVLLLGLASAEGQAQETEDRPNVLVFTIDDLNDWIGPLEGHPQAQTPNINRLAQQGVNFTSAHIQAPVCNPSRTSFLTGLRPSTTGVYGLGTWFRNLDEYSDWTTLPQYFKKHGYYTMTTGKVYHGNFPPEGQRDMDFSKWGYRGGFGPTPDEPFVPETGHPLVDWGVYPEKDTQTKDWKVADWAIKQLRNPPDDKPFFLTVGFDATHVPLYTPQKWFDRYPAASLDLPDVRADDRDDVPRFAWYLHWHLPEPRLAFLRMHREWTRKVRAYLATISYVDMLVGRVMQSLEKQGLRENTIVVFLSDHGYHLGTKSITGKNSLWHESTRVPFIFSGPGVEDVGSSSDEAVEVLDLYPTLVDLAGLPEGDGLDGQSLVPLLQDTDHEREAPAIATHGPNNHAVITEKWRYIRYADGSEELYNRKADPHEWTNLANASNYQHVKQRLAEHLPDHVADPAPGDNVRLIEMIDGVPHWEGEPIQDGDSVPMKYK